MVTHALCGQLAGLERHCAEADARSLAACAKVIPLIPSAALAETVRLCAIFTAPKAKILCKTVVLLMPLCPGQCCCIHEFV